jgi:3(or 17)beta-hydroxysteroid dehydrogenase
VIVQGKVALVTGGASGIGRATAVRLADAGFRLVVSDIDPNGQKVVDAIAGAVFVGHDVTNEPSWERAIDTVLDTHGRLDVLVNNAGIAYHRAITDTALADWRSLMAVNLDGVFLGTKHGVQAMRRHGEGGSIINVSSIAGLGGWAFSSAYSASKGGVRLFTKAIAIECAAEAIRVNSIHPGAVRTPIWGKIGATPERQAAIGAASPLGRMAEPEEVADAILYLASDASRYVTGSELVIDGGVTAGMPGERPATANDNPSAR